MSNNKKLKRNKKYRTQKIASYETITEKYLIDKKLRIGYVEDGFISKKLIMLMEGELKYRTLKEKTITISFKRPSFIDWLFRKNREVKITVNVEEFLSKNEKETIKMYNANLYEAE